MFHLSSRQEHNCSELALRQGELLGRRARGLEDLWHCDLPYWQMQKLCCCCCWYRIEAEAQARSILNSGWMAGEQLSVREKPAATSARSLLFSDGVKRGMAAMWLCLGKKIWFDPACGSRADRACGIQADRACGIRAGRACGIQADRACGSRAGRACGIQADRACRIGVVRAYGISASPRQAAMKRNSSRLNRGTGHTGWMPSSGSSTAIMSVSLWMGSRSRRQIRRSGSGPAASPSSLPTVLSRWTKRASESAPKGRLPSSVSCSTSPGRLGRLVHVICPGHTPRPIVLSAMPCCPGHTCIRAACPRQAASRTKCRCSLHMRPGSSTLE